MRLAVVIRNLLALLAVASFGCASVPKEAVDLSVTVGRDVEAVHRAHVALLNGYFDRLERDVNVFVDTTYRPYCIDRNMKQFGLVEKLKAAPKGTDPLDVMEVFVEAITVEIEDYRGTLLAPIRAQRGEVTGAIEEAYRRIQDAQAVVTGHLASVRRVHDLHEEMLAKADLVGLRDRFVSGTIAVSDTIAKLTTQAKYSGDKLDELAKKLEELKKATQSFK
jgi:hypothetical protein